MNRINIPHTLATILSVPKLRNSYLVGGCVRDAVMGLTPKDFDIEVFGLEYDELAEILGNWGRVDIVGKSFGVIKLTKNGETYDFNLPRIDSKVGDTHRDFKVRVDHGLTLRQAASRRDFTINALAYDPRTEEIIDNFGGLYDIEHKNLRHIGPSFEDDALRVLRGMQFCGRFGLSVDFDTMLLCRKIKLNFHDISAERLWMEWYKWAAMSTKPSDGLWFLEATEWIEHFPALKYMVGCEQDPEWHPEGDVMTHTHYCCDSLVESNDWFAKGKDERATLMMAVLLHDCGKHLATECVMRDGVNRIISPAHDIIGASMAGSFLSNMKAPELFRQQVKALVACHMAHLNTPSKRTVRRLAERLHPATIEQLMVVVQADHAGRPPLPKDMPANALEIQRIAKELNVEASAPKPLILGRHLIELGLKPGPAFKQILDLFFEKQLDGDFDNLEDGKFLLKKAIAEETFGVEPEIGLWEP